MTLELKSATAIIAVISENYSLSRWGQAELHHALATRKAVIPVVTSSGAISELDEPLQRLLRDTQFVDASGGVMDQGAGARFAESTAGTSYFCSVNVYQYSDDRCAEGPEPLGSAAGPPGAEWATLDGSATTSEAAKSLQLHPSCSGEPGFTVQLDDFVVSKI